MKAIAIAAVFAAGPASAAFPAAGSPYLFPKDSALIVHRAIRVEPNTVTTPITEGEGTGCVLRHEKSPEERTLKAGTRLIVEAVTHPNYGDKGLYAAVLQTNFRDVSLFCSTYPGEALTMGAVIRAVAGAFEYARSGPKRLTQIAAASSRLETRTASAGTSAFDAIP